MKEKIIVLVFIEFTYRVEKKAHYDLVPILRMTFPT